MVGNGGGTGIFFVIALGCIGLFLMYWLWAVHNRKRQQRMLGFPSPQPPPARPHPRERSHHHRDPVVRMEAGENADGLPKYTAQAAIGEQTVDRNCTCAQSNQANSGTGTRPSGLMGAAPSFFRQISQLPSRPPPAYDPSTSPPRGT